MVSDDSFAFLLPVIMVTFGFVFLVLARYGHRESTCWSLGYFFAGAAFSMAFVPPVVPAPILSFIADGLFTTAFYFYGSALLIRFQRSTYILPRLAFCVATYAATGFAVFVAQSMAAELVINDLTCAALLTFSVIMAIGRRRHMADHILLFVAGLIVLETIGRNIALVLLIPSYGGADNFLNSQYAFVMQAGASVLALFFALSALAAATLDVIGQYRSAADNDVLTGLLNRRGFERAVEGLPDKVLSSCVVVVCDIDEFKRVNDTYGHAAGDAVIEGFATLIRNRLPAGGVAARFGGEEFVIVLPDHSLDAGALFANALRTTFGNVDRSGLGIGSAVTASFGVATKDHNEHDLRDRIARADLALYAAKEAGRNRVMLDGKPPRDATGIRLAAQSTKPRIVK
ncbi:MAG: GGDEF domain-containing protein, partial [Rhizobiaceae bacterium]|nr:GGDEF domain-containing protein [Rhizobiaceae bacterium]